MSQYSKMKQSRNQWKAKAKQRGERERYQRKQSARHKAKCEQTTKALAATQARLRQLEAQLGGLATRPKVDVVHLALQLFLEARIGFRAVSRVLTLLASALGIKKAPCPQTIINWVMRLSIVRIDSARSLRGLPLSPALFSNGLIWMIDISIGLGTGKILAVLAVDAHHHQRAAGALSLSQVHCIGVSVAPSWTGAAIAEVLKRLITVMGRPAAYLKDGGSELQSRRLAGRAEPGEPLHRRHLPRGGLDPQAPLPTSPGFRGVLVCLWSRLGQIQANHAGVFGAAQGAHQSPLYERAAPVHLGRSGAQTLARGGRQGRFNLSPSSSSP